MYLFYDENGILKEQITTSPVRYGDSDDVNKIYVYWDKTTTITAASCILRKPNGDNTLPISYTSDTSEIPYDQERDLKFFKYNTPYDFLVFDIPTDVFSEVQGVEIYSVLGSVYITYNDGGENEGPKAMGIFAFAVEPSTLSVAADQNINVAQWNELVNMLGGNPDYNDISVKTIVFKGSSSASSGGLSMVDNVIYWKGSALTTASDLTSFITQSDLATYVQFSDLSGYAEKSDLNDYVTLDSAQTITGAKTISGDLSIRKLLISRSGQDGKLYQMKYFNNVGGKTDTYDIVVTAETDDKTYTLTLPAGTGTLALVSDIIQYVQNNAVLIDTNQEIDGVKKIIGTLQIENGIFKINKSSTYSADGRSVCGIDYTDSSNFKTDSYSILVDATPDSRNIGIKLPTTSGTLALINNIPTKTSDLTNDSGFIDDTNVVKTNNSQIITGQKTFNEDVIIDNKKLYIDNATIPANDSEVVLARANVIDKENNDNEATWDIKVGNIDNDGAEYDIFLPPISGQLLSENGYQLVTGQKRFKHLNVDIATSSSPTVNGAVWYKSGKFYGRKTGSDKEFLLEDALTPTFFTATSASQVVFDTTTRNSFKFEIGSDYNGVYVFTHSYLTMLVAIYGLTENQTYKFAGPGISDWNTGSVINSLYNMRRSGNYLYIWSGKTDYQLNTGIVGTLAKIKLY